MKELDKVIDLLSKRAHTYNRDNQTGNVIMACVDEMVLSNQIVLLEALGYKVDICRDKTSSQVTGIKIQSPAYHACRVLSDM